MERSAVHAGELRDVLELHRLYARDGLGLAVQAQIALVLGCSEHRAGELLTAAFLLADLPGALEALECGLLGVEQSRVVVDQLHPLPEPVRLAMWERIQDQLITDHDRSVVRPPARLRPLVSGWVIAADREGAERRRRDATRDADVDYRRRADGLVDLLASGLSGVDAHACLAKLRACSARVGSADDRPAGQRRVEALVDLILGRNPLPVGADDETPVPLDARTAADEGGVHCPAGCACRTACQGSGVRPAGARPAGGAPCGCRPGSPVPCGAELTVLVPLGAALGTTNEIAELVGHGPLEPALLDHLLHAAPALRPVWVDEAGVPVATGDEVEKPVRDDPASVRRAVLRMAAGPAGPHQPRHPDDHLAGHSAPEPESGSPGGSARSLAPADAAPSSHDHPPGASDPPCVEPADHRHDHTDSHAQPSSARPRQGTRAHLVGTPGPYRVPARMRRFLQMRRPLCEWPGCGARAVRCDLDHDVPWPAGATCACNLGPACRRHHQIKQLGWTKQRTRDGGVRWTSPTGQAWTSPVPHQPPEPAVRGLASVPPPPGPLDQFSPPARDDELWHLDPADPHWDDPAGPELRAEDTDPDDELSDPLAQTLLHSDTRWRLDLDDPHAWLEAEAPRS